MSPGCCYKSWTAVALVSGTVLLVIGLVLGCKVFPDLVQEQVSEQILLKPGSESWKLWAKLPVPMDFKVYLFNVTNPAEVHEGETPKVNEMGPYIYKEYREKQDIAIHEEYGTASYKQKIWYEFDPVASAPYTDDDVVTVFNMALMGMIEVADALGMTDGLIGQITNSGLSAIFNGTKNLFLDTPVKNLLFDGVMINCDYPGSETACSMMGSQKLPSTIKKIGNNFYFSLFGFKNHTDDGRYEVKLGWGPLGPYPSVNGAKMVGTITSWDNSSKLDKWQGDECNKISGTDAAIFPPFLTKESRIDIFSTDLCRSLYAVFDSEVTYQGIPSYRFVAEEYLLANVSVNPNNNCFCPEEKACLLKGALDLTSCLEAPVIATLPHFYMASEEYLAKTIGLNPETEKHQTYLEIEPTTGIPLSGGKRIQFNMMMRKLDGMQITHNVPSVLFPFLWIDEGLNLDEENVNKLKDQLINTLDALEIVKWVLIGFGIGLLCIGIFLVIFGVVKNKQSAKM